jgi:hypothetical protein
MQARLRTHVLSPVNEGISPGSDSSDFEAPLCAQRGGGLACAVCASTRDLNPLRLALNRVH